MSSFLAALAAIPAIIGAIKEMWAWLNKISGNDPAGMIVRIHDAFKRANEAKTPEEMQRAASDLARLIRKL